ncbi:hypothetical protein [Tsukamurella pulmonis]|uniref:hypothetical protein n=1 Tax=Tsukamurella pulmonis TaxID=47312 RepID=UPI001EE07389|nr:hypothetical protein [Tsukamurella pulmonis]
MKGNEILQQLNNAAADGNCFRLKSANGPSVMLTGALAPSFSLTNWMQQLEGYNDNSGFCKEAARADN